MQGFFFNYCILVLWLIVGVTSTISPGNKLKPTKVRTGPQDDNVFDRNLVQKEPLAKDILNHANTYFKNVALRHFNGSTLGYVTAWNSHGYDVAKIFAKKFDIISPVWFQINKQNEQYVIAGSHDIDATWIKDVRRKGTTDQHVVKIFPRIIFEKFTERDFSRLLSYDTERSKLQVMIVDLCKQHNFDGIVLELWSQLAKRVDDEFLYMLIKDLSKSLQRENLRLILVIPPYRTEINLFSEKHLEQLYKHVYAFSLMTYDYSNVQRPGANAPLHWVRKAIEYLAPSNAHDVKTKRRKILMGLNMYGNDYTPDGGGAIVNNQYLDLVKNVKKRLVFDEYDVENYFEVKTNTGRHTVFYPSLHSINERIKLADEYGVGISIWELGQGLDYFYDLF